MPTSKNRSGNRCRNLESPVGPGMAAVIATMSRRLAPYSISDSANVDVQPGPGTDVASPVSGSMTPQECIWSSSSFSAGAYPMPLRVTTCTITGALKPRALRSALSTACSSWPSIGPTYLMPRSVNITCGEIASLMPALMLCMHW